MDNDVNKRSNPWLRTVSEICVINNLVATDLLKVNHGLQEACGENSLLFHTVARQASTFGA